MKTAPYRWPQRKPCAYHAGKCLTYLGSAAAILIANALSCPAATMAAIQPPGHAVVNPATMLILQNARTELTSGEWSESLRNFRRYLKIQPTDNAAMLEYLSLSRQQHKPGAALKLLAVAAANGSVPAARVRRDWHVLIGPYPSQGEMEKLIRSTGDHGNALPSAAVAEPKHNGSLEQRTRAWRYFLLAIGTSTAGDRLAATGFGYAAENLDSHLPGIQKFVAWELFLRHKYTAADLELRTGIRHLNHHPDRLVMQLAIDMGQDRTDAALRLALACQRLHPHRLLGHWLLARVYRARGQQRPEIHELLIMLNFFPNFAPAYRSLLRIAMQKKNTALTQRIEQLYAENFPTDPRSVIFAVRNAERHGSLVEADKLLRAGGRRYPASKRIALAIWQEDIGHHRFAQSAEDIRLALTQSPDDSALTSALLRSLLALGHPRQAMAAARAFAARQLRSRARQAIYMNLLLNLHQPATAEKWLSRLATVMPHQRWVTRLKVQMLARIKKPQQALALLKLLTHQPEPRISDMLALADASYKQGNLTAYLMQMQRILAIEPTNAEANNDLAYFWAQRHQHLAKSLAMAKLSVREYPRDTASRDTLGWIYYRLGQFHPALEEFRIAITLPGGDNAAEFLHLGDTWHKLNKNNFALHCWQHGIALLKPAAGLSQHDRKLRARLLKRITREKKFQALDGLPSGQGL